MWRAHGFSHWRPDPHVSVTTVPRGRVTDPLGSHTSEKKRNRAVMATDAWGHAVGASIWLMGHVEVLQNWAKKKVGAQVSSPRLFFFFYILFCFTFEFGIQDLKFKFTLL
jgi:hypothetical protein